MLLNILRKLPIAAFAAVLLVPAAPAFAWDQICMKFPAFKTWFAGRMHVAYGFDVSPSGKVPDKTLGPGGFSGGGDWEAKRRRLDEIYRSIPEAEEAMHAVERSRGWGSSECSRKYALPECLPTRDHLWALWRERDEITKDLPLMGWDVLNLPGNNDASLPPAAGVMTTGKILAVQRKCLSLRDVPIGDRFYVFMEADRASTTVTDFGDKRYLLCTTHPTNPNIWYANRNSSYGKTLEYEAWGHAWKGYTGIHCEFKREY